MMTKSKVVNYYEMLIRKQKEKLSKVERDYLNNTEAQFRYIMANKCESFPLTLEQRDLYLKMGKEYLELEKLKYILREIQRNEVGVSLCQEENR